MTSESARTALSSNGDLNNTEALRKTALIQPQMEYLDRSLAIPTAEDDAEIRKRYRHFLFDEKTASSDWISRLEITTAMKMVDDDLKRTGGDRLKILVLHGSMRKRSYSRLLARWMRMFAIPNQSSVPKAYTQFEDEDGGEGGARMLSSGNRERLVDCMEELVKYTAVMRLRFGLFGDWYSERAERGREEAAVVSGMGTGSA